MTVGPPHADQAPESLGPSRADAGQPPVHLPFQPVGCLPASTRHKTPKPFSVSASHRPGPGSRTASHRRKEMANIRKKIPNHCVLNRFLRFFVNVWKDFPHSHISEDGLSVPRREVSGAPPLRKMLRPSHEVSIKLGPLHKDTQRPAMPETECLENSCLANRCPKNQQRYSYKRQQGSQ